MNSATRDYARLPSPQPPFPCIYYFAGVSFDLVWVVVRVQASSKKKRRNSKYKLNRCLRSSYHIVFGLKKIHPRHPPREFPLGLRAPVLGMGTAQIPGNEPFPFLVGERMLLSPVRCLGSCSLRSHPAERDRAHPTRPHKPLSGFSCRCLVCRFRCRFLIAYHTGARL